jgi:allophanate hydrolase subunit 2
MFTKHIRLIGNKATHAIFAATATGNDFVFHYMRRISITGACFYIIDFCLPDWLA